MKISGMVWLHFSPYLGGGGLFIPQSGHITYQCVSQVGEWKRSLSVSKSVDQTVATLERLTIDAPMIYTAPCVMFLMRANTYEGKVEGLYKS